MEEVGKMLFARVGEEYGYCISDHNSSTESAYKEDEKVWKNRRK